MHALVPQTPASVLVGLHALPRADELLTPWAPENLSVYPFGPGWWPFNPSIHRDSASGVWRCLVRCANYTLPDGIPHLSPEARLGRARTRNVLLTLDPETLRPTALAEVVEPDDGPPRAPTCTSLGLEDLRLFRTAADGLCAVGCALQHNLPHPNRPEVVVCRFGEEPTARARPPRGGSLVRSFDGSVDVIPLTSVVPLRGAWGFRPQKNWVPFDDTDAVRLLYSIERGVVMTEHGPLPGSPLPVLPRTDAPASRQVLPQGRSNAEVRLFGRPVAVVSPTQAALLERHHKLRGGSQLVGLSDGRWLGLAHEMTFSQVGRAKFYWHTFYTVDASGALLEKSPPLRLSGDHGIEFAAGLAVDDTGRVAVSYGTDDHQAWVATTTLAGVLGILRPLA